jgi:anti-anti-sigma factor
LAASPDGLRVESTSASERARLELIGEVDAATAPLLDAKINEAASAGAREIELSCAGLDFIDSSGLSVLVANHTRLVRAGCTLVVSAPPPAAQRLFEISGLDRILTIRTTDGPG